MTKKLTVVAVDDHPLNHVAIKSLLDETNELTLVGQGNSGEDVLQLVEMHRPDVLILDLGMPQKADAGDGSERFLPLPTLATLSDLYPSTGVIVLSQYLHRGIIQEAIRIGVRGYLLKSDDLSLNLADAVTTVGKGGVFFSNEFSRDLFQGPTRVKVNPLTKRQQEIIQAIAREPDASYAQIAASLFITESTLKGHLNKAFRALDVTNFTACLITCMHKGLVAYTHDGQVLRFD